MIERHIIEGIEFRFGGSVKNKNVKPGCVQHDCAGCAADTRRITEAVTRLENAEPLIRGWAEGPVSLAHQNVTEALDYLKTSLRGGE